MRWSWPTRIVLAIGVAVFCLLAASLVVYAAHRDGSCACKDVPPVLQLEVEPPARPAERN